MLDDIENCLPENVELSDDTLLPKIQFHCSKSNPALDALQQSFLLLICYYKFSSGPTNQLSDEQIQPYLDVVLENPKTYMIGRYSLYLRSSIERQSTRKCERTLLQLETLINELNIVSKNDNRLNHWQIVVLLPYWRIKELLAQTLFELGCVNSAIEYYIDLKSYYDLTMCYIACGRREKAEHLIKETIKKQGETPQLLCLLGQINDDPTYYHLAWAKSKCKSFRSQYELAYYHLRYKNYIVCIEHFEKALEINSIQPNAWYNYGCALMELKLYDRAANAFRTSCHFQPQNYKCWTNLATTLYIKSNFAASHQAIQVAISCNFHHYQLWIKLAEVSIILNLPYDVIKSFERLIDSSPTNIDNRLIVFLSSYCNTSEPNVRLFEFKRRFLEGLNNLSTKCTLSYEAWWMFARVQDSDNVNDIQKTFDHYTCSLRCLIFEKTTFEKDLSLQTIVIKIIEEIFEKMDRWESVCDTDYVRNVATTMTLTVDAALGRLKKFLDVIKDDTLMELITNNMIKLENFNEKFNNKYVV